LVVGRALSEPAAGWFLAIEGADRGDWFGRVRRRWRERLGRLLGLRCMALEIPIAHRIGEHAHEAAVRLIKCRPLGRLIFGALGACGKDKEK